MQLTGVRLVLLATLVSSAPGWASDPFIEEVPGTQPRTMVEVPGLLYSDGIPVRLRQTHSSWKIDDLFRYYYKHFESSGLFIPNEQEQLHTPTGYVLTGIDPKTLVSYTLIFQPTPDGSTTLMLGSALPANRDTSGQSVTPIYPGAKNVLHSSSEVHHTVTYDVLAKPGEVTRFYADTLGRAGYVAEKEPGSFTGPGHHVQVMTKALSPEHTAVSVTTKDTSRDEPPPPHN